MITVLVNLATHIKCIEGKLAGNKETISLKVISNNVSLKRLIENTRYESGCFLLKNCLFINAQLSKDF